MVTEHRQPDLRDRTGLPGTASTVIIGAGIVGIATAWHLRRRGEACIVLDAAPEIASRTTSMSAHCIRAQFSEPDSMAMMAESLSFYETFAERLDLVEANSPIGLTQQGYLFASTDLLDLRSLRERVQYQHRSGLDDVEFLEGDEVRYRYPWLSEAIVGATFRRRDGWIDSAAAVRLLAWHSRVPIHLDSPVGEIVVEGGRVTGVDVAGHRISTDRVILAAGPFTAALSPEPLPLSPVRRHRLVVGPREDIPQSGPVTIDANTGAHWRPHEGGALMAWAQPEESGEPVWPVPTDPTFVDLVLRGERGVGRIAPFWHQLWPDLTTSELLLTAGQYTMTPDHRPLIGPAPVTGGLFVNSGYSGHGIMGAPAGARLLADLVTGTPHASNPFSPSRSFTDPAGLPNERMVI